MKYAEALTNLHKSGINRNSTPQEIAAASVGTKLDKNGTPNISSVSQGQSYGSALKNLKSNPQPNANQNSNGAKPNTTGSQNNTNNKANTNPTGSTKPSSSASTSRSANSTSSTSSSTRLSNADYNRLAAQIVGVPTDKNGNPVCNSYEQYTQFGQTLANLHNGGINRNSTPQEIAAASVGTNIKKDGTPNISSVSQGQSYGSALKNLKSNPQPNVNQNSNGTKPNTTGSQNNTGNKADTNPTGSTRPSSSANANRPASSTNSMSSSNKFTNEEYSKMAAQITGVYTDSNGKTIFISYEQSMKYAQALTNLHNGRIDKTSTPQEIAAASVGIKLDKYGNPIFSNDTQRQNYDIALNVTSQMIEDVSSGAPIQSSGNKVSVNNNSQSTDSTSLSTIYLGKHSEGFESYLRNLEKTYGTQYVFENGFKGDKNKYDPYKRASQITGIPLRGDAPVECGLAGKKAFEAALYGTKNNNDNKADGANNVTIGVGYADTDVILEGKVYTDGKVTVGLFDAPKYTVVAGDGVNKAGTYVISEAEREHLIYLVLHEAAGRLDLDNPEAQAVALASTFLNMYETDGRDTFAESLADGCYKHGHDKDGYMQNTLKSKVDNGDYSGLDISDWEQWPQLVENATNAVDTVLGGTRTTNATQWHGESELDWTYNRFTDSKNVPGLTYVG